MPGESEIFLITLFFQSKETMFVATTIPLAGTKHFIRLGPAVQ